MPGRFPVIDQLQRDSLLHFLPFHGPLPGN